MISMLHSRSVSPPQHKREGPPPASQDESEPVICVPCEGEESLMYGEDEDADLELALIDDPIVGVERAVSSKEDHGALVARPLASPPSMSPEAVLKHCLTHLPYHPGCPICVASRRPNTQHRKSHESSRLIPLLVGDYGFIRSSLDSRDKLQTVLVVRVLPYKLTFASIVPVKGLDMLVAQRVSHFIREAGLVHFAYKHDREHAVTALLEESVRLSGRRGVPTESEVPDLKVQYPVPLAEDDEPDAPTDIPQARTADGALVSVPELTLPGESQSNGLAERTI